MNILNYQGNKDRLTSFLKTNVEPYIPEGKFLFDIFSGGGSVCQAFCKNHGIYANDIEPYASEISAAILKRNHYSDFDECFFEQFSTAYQEQLSELVNLRKGYVELEKKLIPSKNGQELSKMYKDVPTLWNGKYSNLLESNISSKTIRERKLTYCLFSLLYPSNYFGVTQAAQIDSIKYAIDNTMPRYNKHYLYASLFHAMNQAVFSKDGHMAQPLSLEKNESRLIKCRSVDIYERFILCLDDYSLIPNSFSKENKVFNNDFLNILKDQDLSKVGCIYADPPYTDMQYSRYYHLLNTVFEYSFADPTIIHGKYSTGLYLQNRHQSEISQRKSFLPSMKKLFEYCKEKGINLCLSFGYPQNIKEQKTSRYLTSIDDLISLSQYIFGIDNVKVIGHDYSHANQRNSAKKKVVEYLICCKGERNER